MHLIRPAAAVAFPIFSERFKRLRFDSAAGAGGQAGEDHLHGLGGCGPPYLPARGHRGHDRESRHRPAAQARYLTGFAARPLVTLRHLLPARAFDQVITRATGPH
jgi:hypothetical protein